MIRNSTPEPPQSDCIINDLRIITKKGNKMLLQQLFGQQFPNKLKPIEKPHHQPTRQPPIHQTIFPKPSSQQSAVWSVSAIGRDVNDFKPFSTLRTMNDVFGAESLLFFAFTPLWSGTEFSGGMSSDCSSKILKRKINKSALSLGGWTLMSDFCGLALKKKLS